MALALDSGSMINVVPMDLAHQFGLPLTVSRTLVIKGAGGAQVAYFGKALLHL